MKVYINKSTIHGEGLFAAKDLFIYEYLFTVIKDHKITKIGEKINHSYSPNCILIRHENDFEIYANENIDKDTELTVHYDYTPPYIKKSYQYFPRLK